MHRIGNLQGKCVGTSIETSKTERIRAVEPEGKQGGETGCQWW